MKLTIQNTCLFLSLVLCGITVPGKCQDYSTASSYMDYMGKQNRKIMEDMWDYTTAVAHNKSARKVESRRRDLLATNLTTQQNISKMPAFEGDQNLRDSTVSFLKLSYQVINYDYSRIVDMEEVAEQSYDAMEAYMLAQQIANEKLDLAGKRLDAEETVFAKKHNINLVEGNKDKLSRNLEKANYAFKYYNSIYLIFFKSYKEDFYMGEAIGKSNINAIEQNRNSLSKYTAEGSAKLDTIKPYAGDNSVKMACKQVLDFYKIEATLKIPIVVNYYMKKESFEKTKAAFDAKLAQEHTRADVDEYNKAVADYNKGTTDFNNVMQELSKRRQLALDNWNKTVQSFFERQVPKR